MNELFIYEEIKDGGTFVVDDTTTTAVKANPEAIIGKVVTMTGDFKVGYGSSGDNPFGFVVQVEKELTNSNRLVVSVLFNTSREFIESTGVSFNNYVACDGAGGVVKSTTPTSARAWGKNDDSTHTVYIHG